MLEGTTRAPFGRQDSFFGNEGFGKMAEAFVADFESGFRDVVPPVAQQFGGSLDSDFAQFLAEGLSGVLLEKTAQVMRGASHVVGHRRKIEVVLKMLPYPNGGGLNSLLKWVRVGGAQIRDPAEEAEAFQEFAPEPGRS